MDNTVNQLPIEQFKLNDYYDKSGNLINFNVFFIEDKEDSHLTQLIVQASINEEVAGYISLLYLSEVNKLKYFNSAWDFYFDKKISQNLKNLMQDDLPSFLKEVNSTFDLSVSNLNDFQSFATTKIKNEYTKFISFYLNKPYPEIVTVYSDKDKATKDFSDFPFMNVQRQPTNFLNQGVANALYHSSCHILKQKNMQLYASNNQTLDGQRMWQHLEKNPKFLTLSDTYFSSLTTDRKNIIEVQRKKVTI